MLKVTPFSKAVALSANVATGAAPTLVTDGLNMTGVRHVVVTVSADQGQLLTGTGSIQGYRRSDALGRWARDPELDFNITNANVTWANVRDRACAEFDIGVYFGYVAWVPNGVALDGGTNATITIEGVSEF